MSKISHFTLAIWPKLRGSICEVDKGIRHISGRRKAGAAAGQQEPQLQIHVEGA